MPFVMSPWSSPEAELDAADYCSVCLIDMNEAGKEKVKALCKLPIRSTPGGPINVQGMHSAAAAMAGARTPMIGVSPEKKRAAARRLIRMYREHDEVAPESVYRIAGERRPAE